MVTIAMKLPVCIFYPMIFSLSVLSAKLYFLEYIKSYGGLSNHFGKRQLHKLKDISPNHIKISTCKKADRTLQNLKFPYVVTILSQVAFSCFLLTAFILNLNKVEWL